MNSIGERIREARKKCGLTMKNLHDITGLSTGNISDMENNKYMPSVASLVPLSRALKCSIDWLITGEDYTSVTQKPEIRASEDKPICDGVPLTESESDLIAMYRLIPEVDKKTVFDITKLKYDQYSGEKESIYSTYADTNKQQKSDPKSGSKSKHGIA